MTSNLETRIAEADKKLKLVGNLLRSIVDTEQPSSLAIAEAIRHVEEARSKLRGEL